VRTSSDLPNRPLTGVREKEKESCDIEKFGCESHRTRNQEGLCWLDQQQLPNRMTDRNQRVMRQKSIIMGPDRAQNQEDMCWQRQQITTPDSDCCQKSVVSHPGQRPLSIRAAERIPTAASH
jgi:hypothetical protein